MRAALSISRIAGFAAAAFLICSVAQARSKAEARGEYLTKRVAMCVQCHSPRDDDGKLIESELFQGAPIPLQTLPSGWAIRAPRISNFPEGWSRQEFVHFLQTGVRPDGTHPRRPMPPFRMNRQDASAIAAYLDSLKYPGAE